MFISGCSDKTRKHCLEGHFYLPLSAKYWVEGWGVKVAISMQEPTIYTLNHCLATQHPTHDGHHCHSLKVRFRLTLQTKLKTSCAARSIGTKEKLQFCGIIILPWPLPERQATVMVQLLKLTNTPLTETLTCFYDLQLK